MRFDSIEDAIADIQEGKMIILVDDQDRENEGDLVCAAEKTTPEIINFMSKYGRGLVCLAMDKQQTNQLQLALMSPKNESQFSTNFTISIEAAKGVTTGISAADRSHTILTAVQPDATPHDIVSPGHIFPILAKDGGVLERAGQTEGAVDLARLANMRPSGVICEVMNDDGTMARYPELRKFADEHQMKLVTIADLIKYRKRNETMIKQIAESKLPTQYGTFRLIGFESILDQSEYIALVMGEISPTQPILTRVHSQCLTGDVFGSYRCDCGKQLHNALSLISQEQQGVLLYLPQEGRGIGLLNKIKAYHLQDHGADTVEANTQLGFSADLRDYGIGAQALTQLGLQKLRLMTNNPKKIVGLEGHGLEVIERVPLEVTAHNENTSYLQIKKQKMGHLLKNISIHEN